MDIQDEVERRTRLAEVTAVPQPADALVLPLLDDFASMRDPADLLRVVLTRAVVQTGSDRGVIAWIEGDDMVVGHCYDPFGAMVPVGSRWPLAGDTLSQLGSALGASAGSSPDGVHSDRGHLAVVPVTVAGEDIALICVSRRRAEEYDESDTRVLGVIARAAAQPLHVARVREELARAKTELAEHTHRAEEVERVKTDILRLASHELRTPLTVLNGYLSLINDGFFGRIPEQLTLVMAILQRRTADMNSLVNDMLVAARVEEGQIDVGGSVADMRDVVRGAVAAVAPRASAAHRLAVDVPDQPVMVRMDADPVTMAVRNIVDNAVKYSPSGGEVACQLSVDDGCAMLRVTDHGLGIAPRDRAKIFTRFGRILTSDNSHIPGIGLGLYFTREVARRHGGDVRLAGAASDETVFELTLPLSSD